MSRMKKFDLSLKEETIIALKAAALEQRRPVSQVARIALENAYPGKVESKETLKNIVFQTKWKHGDGLIQSEIDSLTNRFPDINMDKFREALAGVTCHEDPEDGTIIYHIDVFRALLCGLENRSLKSHEWD